ncbi:RsmE family RNA methyltransferase [Mariniblastus fucicola]|uniref:Ribosomal RNA small subunit methyltransferase E n=1 Tax=Mariniblastus fucicola TaxID=980251 RepID=A0A5B9PCG6_9BACT|nr:RsmE family RNA methyltransferase [Mariniblastus fucicola]QEG22612.1 Ribosomal RNA small subunit methyltransferase E [Mariniblastus fucicola]
MAERFFLSQPVRENKVTLGDDQAHHLVRVMRAKPGDQIVLFDGCGNEYHATIADVSKKSVSLAIDSTEFVADPNDPEIIVACALPKGDRQKFLIEKMVELGCNQFVPLKTSRSVAEASPKVIERIEKQVVEASKQCRRSWLMKVGGQETVESLIGSFADFDGSRLVADPYATRHDLLLQPDACVIAVGPEGGFTDAENQSLRDSDWTPVCFSPNVLRIETAAAAAVAIARQAKFKRSLS